MVSPEKFFRKGKNSFGVGDLEGLLLQISFAIMMVFMMAYFLFRNRSATEREEQLLDLERQKLLVARDAVNGEYMSRYGLDWFLDDEGAIRQGIDVLDGESISTNAFAAAAFLKAARSGRGEVATESFQSDWKDLVLRKAGIDPQSISGSGMKWLGAESERSHAFFSGSLDSVFAMALTELQEYWAVNPPAAGSVRDILERLTLSGEDEEARLLVVAELQTRLGALAKERLESIAGTEIFK